LARRRYRRSGYDAGRARALRHIEEARIFSREIGGSDEDVKKYFFSLSPAQLRPVLDEYEARHGHAAREYAERVLPRWRTGRTKMGGDSAKRLFDLLPPRMTLSAKYGLVENLWEHFGPRSKKMLRIGLDANIEMVVRAVNDHVESTVANYKIPDNLETRFTWLSAGDVHVKQELLNYFRQKDKERAVESTREKVPVMLEHLRSDDGRHTHRLAEILKVGKHELEITLDRSSSGVALLEPSLFRNQVRNIPWVWFILAGLVLWYYLSQ
jgi:hypothetical protein